MRKDSDSNTKSIYLFIVNPIAGDRDKNDFFEALEESSFSEQNYEIIETTGEGDEGRLSEKLKEGNFTDLVAVGGDGTFKLVADVVISLKEYAFNVGIIPMGSANGLAGELGIPTEISECLEVLKSGVTRNIDAVKLNGHLSFHLADIGVNGYLVKRFEEGDRRGMLGYGLELLKSLPAMDKFRVEIIFDGEARSYETYMVVFANARTYGTGAVINPEGSMSDGEFEIIIIKELEINGLIQMLAKPEKFDESFIEVIKCKKGTLKTERPVSFQIDGEYIEKVQKIEASILPQCISLISPQ